VKKHSTNPEDFLPESNSAVCTSENISALLPEKLRFVLKTAF